MAARPARPSLLLRPTHTPLPPLLVLVLGTLILAINTLKLAAGYSPWRTGPETENAARSF